MSHDASRQIRGSGIPFISGATNASFSSTGLPISSSGGENCTGLSGDHSISLAAPRPEHQRSSNVYVDTPFQHIAPFNAGSTPGSSRTISSIHHPHQDLPLVHGTNLAAEGRLALPPLQKQQIFKKPSHQVSEPTPSLQFKKPSSAPSVKKPISQIPSTTFISQQPKPFQNNSSEQDESIICRRCGRCRCEACTTRRPPRGIWLFGDKCHCSPSEAVDYMSCLCCVKGVLYHCGKDSNETPSVDRLCSCSAPDAALTWVCLTAASVPLPCLLCYWPLTWIRRLCEGTYLRFVSHGCRCNSTTIPSVPSRPHTPSSFHEKRLLHDNCTSLC